MSPALIIALVQAGITIIDNVAKLIEANKDNFTPEELEQLKAEVKKAQASVRSRLDQLRDM